MTDRKLHLGYDDAKTLWELGALTEDRSDDEHNVLLRLDSDDRPQPLPPTESRHPMNDEIIHFIRDICRLERDYYVAFGEGYEYQPQYQAAMRALEARCAELELRFR